MGLHFSEAPGRPKCWSRLEAVVGAFDRILLTDGICLNLTKFLKMDQLVAGI